MRALHYEESLSSWEVAAYARPKLSIRITDGCYRLVTHIPLPVGLAIEARARDDRVTTGPPLTAAPRAPISADTSVGDRRPFGPDAAPRRRRKAL